VFVNYATGWPIDVGLGRKRPFPPIPLSPIIRSIAAELFVE
jgi:hypothetical protein